MIAKSTKSAGVMQRVSGCCGQVADLGTGVPIFRNEYTTPDSERLKARRTTWFAAGTLLLTTVLLHTTVHANHTNPNAPGSCSATPGNGRITLSWTEATDHPETYEVLLTGRSRVTGLGVNVRMYTWTGLNNRGTLYDASVRARNSVAVGSSCFVNGVLATIVSTPTNLTATPGNGQVILSWNASATGSPATGGYQYQQKAGAATSFDPWQPAGGETSRMHTVTGLNNGAAYTFRVRATNAAGNSGASAEAAATPAATPGAPANLTATPGDRRATLSWSAPAEPITGYDYMQDNGGWQMIPNSDADTLSFTVTGLANNTTYTFRVRARHNTIIGAASAAVMTTPEGPPPAPANLTAMPGTRQATLSWSAPPGPITGYDYMQDSGGWQAIPDSNMNTLSFTATGLSDGATYIFRVRARNAHGDGMSSTPVSVITLPGAPTGLNATAGDTQVRLSWTAPSGSVTSWEYSQDTMAWTLVPGGNAGTRAHTVRRLSNGVAYSFRVRAVNSSGVGAASGAISTTPTRAAVHPDVPTAPTVGAGDRQVRLSWTAPSGLITGWEYKQGDNGWMPVPGGDENTRSYVVGGLSNGLTYNFQVRAYNSAGCGNVSATIEATPSTPTGAPGWTSDHTAEAGDGLVRLSWGNTSGVVQFYRYRPKELSDEPWVPIPNSNMDTRSYTVTGLNNGEFHQFRVQAVNSFGVGVPSGFADVTPRAATVAPGVPTNLTAMPGNRRATLYWEAPHGDIAGYQYRSKTGGGYGDWENTDGIATFVEVTSTGVTRLANGTPYTFQVRAVNSAGESAESNEAAVTPREVAACAGTPGAPTNLTATPGDRRATLLWSAPAEPVTGYDYMQDNGGWQAIPNSDADTLSFTVTGLTNNTTYTFRVRARHNTIIGVVSAAVMTTPEGPPAAPANLTAMPGTRQATLSWSAPPGPITGYDYMQDSGGWQAIPDSNMNTLSFTATGLSDGATYIFRVRARNAHGDGMSSTPVSVITLPGAPTGLNATAGDTQVRLSWTAPSGSVTSWEYSQDTMAWTLVPGGNAGTRAHTVRRLSNGVAYSFRVRAVNSSGVGAASGAISTTPTRAAVHPDVPTAPTVGAGDRQVRLSWTAPSGLITGWEYKQGDNGWMPVPGGDENTRSYVVGGLSNGLTYNFQVRAYNSAGCGNVSATIEATPSTPTGAPGWTSDHTAEAGDGLVRLSWGNTSGVVQFYRYRPKELSDEPWVPIPNSNMDTRSYTVTGLNNGEFHQFRVQAVNSFGVGVPSGFADVTPRAATVAPGVPTNLTAMPGNRRATLYWEAPHGDIAGYQYRSKTGGGYGDWENTDGIATFVEVTSTGVTRLANGTPYTFQVRAVNSAGESAESNEAAVTPREVMACIADVRLRLRVFLEGPLQ